MIMGYIECGVQLVFILGALLFSLFRYISCKKRGWLYSVGYFAASLLSSYFWTFYMIIMGEDPNASSFLTYLGWNTAFLILLLLILDLKESDERRYFHPLMLLPIPLNIVQFMIYTQFGGVLLSAYQVLVNTVTACLCIQSLMWYLKKRGDGARKPYVAAVSLITVIAEFGMWTSTCYEGWIHDLYYPFSFLSSFSYILLLWALTKTYKGDTDAAQEILIDRRIQDIIKRSYTAIAVFCSLGGFFLCTWIRDLLDSVSTEAETDTDVYGIISAVLFLISLILAAFAVAIVIIVYFEQRISENNRLREEKQLAEQSNAAKSDFLANMSHEIRTPINAVLGMNKMIILEALRAKEQPQTDAAALHRSFSDIYGYAENIESAGNNLLSIINDILDFSKIEAGKIDIIEHDYMLSSVINDLSNLVQFRAKEKGLGFDIEVDETIPDQLFGDDVRLRQVTVNLLSNAVKYTDSGKITLSFSRDSRHDAGGETELTISVKDTGIGIRQEELERIFDKFERTDLERNSTVEGTGLGLAITNRLVSMMGGSITVKSRYGEGSEFTIILPQKVVSDEPIGDFRAKFMDSINAPHDTEHYFRAPDARILIVDDTRMNLAVAAGLIKDAEIQTDTAESGRDALLLTLANRYDLILMDQRMPVMDGTETLHRLREQENGLNTSTPVICLTADALAGAKERYMAQGFTDYLSKPIDSRKLKQTLMQYLPQDKLLPAEDQRTAEREDTLRSAHTDEVYRPLRAMGIDTAAGLAYCNEDRELYGIMLSEYINSSHEKIGKLRKYFGEGDAKNYAIIVHSLKSTSRTIGENNVADMAAELEKAADKGLIDTMTNAHEALLEAYERVVREMAEATGLGEDTPTDSSEEYEIMEFFPE